MKFIAALFVFLIILIVIEGIYRFLKMNPEISRKLAHILSSLVVIFLPYFLTRNELFALAGIFGITLIFAKHSRLLQSLSGVKRTTWGEIFFPLGCGITAWLFLEKSIPSFQYGILVLGVSDGMAGFVGQKYGRSAIPFVRGKTIEGSLVFFAFTLLLMPFFFQMQLFFLKNIFVALGVTVIEAISPYGTDNITVPVAAGAFGLLLLSAG